MAFTSIPMHMPRSGVSWRRRCARCADAGIAIAGLSCNTLSFLVVFLIGALSRANQGGSFYGLIAAGAALVTVFREGEPAPGWCELRAFTVDRLKAGDASSGRRAHPKERILVTAGSLQIREPGCSSVLRDGQYADISANSWEVVAGFRGAEYVRLSGRWGEELGGCGVFRAENEVEPTDIGDPVAYRKSTSVDSHYHDCDEYWIVLEGSGTVVVGDRHFEVHPGDCVAIGMGHHHDLPVTRSPVKAVYFETTLEGRQRFGHLWNHTHGPAEPRMERH